MFNQNVEELSWSKPLLGNAVPDRFFEYRHSVLSK